MQIQLISHASVVIFCDEVGIWTDPWLVGKAFNNSWSLLPTPKNVEIPYEKIKYLWISHEHPDHFNVPTLKSLPESFKKTVTVLFQKTNSDKIFNALQKFGYENFLPMENKKRLKLPEGIEVYCYQNHFIDSCLGVKFRDQVIFNVNDAEIEEKDCRRILADLGKVDVCLNQFSLAGYRGFAERDKFLPQMAAEKLNRITRNHKDLNAACTLPFASFVYFSTQDNQYMNQYVNKPADVFRHFQELGLNCALLYPGDVWNISEAFDSASNAAKYKILFDNLDVLPYDKPPVIPEAEIFEAFNKMAEILHDHYPAMLLKQIPAFTVYIEDLGICCRFNLYQSRAERIDVPASKCDISVYSQPLHFGFKYPFGVETLTVSARVTVQNNFDKWQRFKRLCVLNSADIYLHPKYLLRIDNLSYLWQRVTSSILSQVLERAKRQKKLFAQTTASSSS